MLRHCTTCTTRYAHGLLTCPHCGADDTGNRDDGDDLMPKNTLHGGPTNADVEDAPALDAEDKASAEVVEVDGNQDSGPDDGVRPAEPESVSVNAEAAEGTGDGHLEPEAEPVPEPPADGATKSDWVAYAVDVLGMDQAEVDAMTKAALIDRIRGS